MVEWLNHPKLPSKIYSSAAEVLRLHNLNITLSMEEGNIQLHMKNVVLRQVTIYSYLKIQRLLIVYD